MNWLTILNLVLPVLQTVTPLVLAIVSSIDASHPQAAAAQTAAAQLQGATTTLTAVHAAANGSQP